MEISMSGAKGFDQYAVHIGSEKCAAFKYTLFPTKKIDLIPFRTLNVR